MREDDWGPSHITSISLRSCPWPALLRPTNPRLLPLQNQNHIRGGRVHEKMICCFIQDGEGASTDVGSSSAGKSMAQLGRLGALGEEQNQLCFPLKDISAHQWKQDYAVSQLFFQATCLKVLHLDWNEVVRCIDIHWLQLMTTDTCNHCNFCVDYCPPAPSWPAHWSRWPQILPASPHGSCSLFLPLPAKWFAVWPRCMQKRFASTPSSQLDDIYTIIYWEYMTNQALVSSKIYSGLILFIQMLVF